MQIFVYSIIQYPVSSFAQTLDFSQLYDFSFFFSFRTLVIRIPSAKITQNNLPVWIYAQGISMLVRPCIRGRILWKKVISHFMSKITYTQISILV